MLAIELNLVPSIYPKNGTGINYVGDIEDDADYLFYITEEPEEQSREAFLARIDNVLNYYGFEYLLEEIIV